MSSVGAREAPDYLSLTIRRLLIAARALDRCLALRSDVQGGSNCSVA